MDIDAKALGEVMKRLDDLDDAVRGIATLVSVLVLNAIESFGPLQTDADKAVAEANRNLQHPSAFESSRT